MCQLLVVTRFLLSTLEKAPLVLVFFLALMVTTAIGSERWQHFVITAVGDIMMGSTYPVPTLPLKTA